MPTQSSSDLEEGELPRKEPTPPPPTQPRYTSTPVAPRSTQLVAPPSCLPHRPPATAAAAAAAAPYHRPPTSTLPAKPAIGPPLPPQQEQFHRFCAATQQQRGWDPPAGQGDKEIRRREHDAWHRRDYHDLDEEDHYFMARDGRPPIRINDDRPPIRIRHDDFAAPSPADWNSPPPRRINDDRPPYRNDDDFATPPPAGWHPPRNGNHFDPSRPLPPHMSNRKTPAELAAIAEHYEARKQERIALAHQQQMRRDRDLEDALRQRSRDGLSISRPSSSSGRNKRTLAADEPAKPAITTFDLQRRLELLEKELAETKAQAAASAAAAAQASSSNAAAQGSGSKDVDANVTIQASSKDVEPNAAHASSKSLDHDRPRSKRRRKSSRTPSPAPTHRSGTMGMKRSEAEREERGPRTRGEESRAQRRRGDSGEAEDEARPGTSDRPKERKSREGRRDSATSHKRQSKEHRDDESRPSSRRDHDRERARPADKDRPTSRKSHRSKEDVRNHSPRPRSRRDDEAGEEEHRTKDQRRLEDRQRHEEHQRKARALLERGPSRGSARTSHRRSKPAVEQRRSPEPQPEPQASAEDKQPRTRQPSAYQCEKWFVEDPAAQAEFQGRDYGNLPAPLPAPLTLDEGILRPVPPQDEIELDYGSATPAQSQTQDQVKRAAAEEPVGATKSQGQDLNPTSQDLNSLRLAALSTLKRKRSHETEASTHSTRRDSSDSASSNDTPSTANSSNTSLDTQVPPPADECASSRILPPPGCLYLRPTTAGAATPFTTTCTLPPAPLTAPLPPTSSPSLRLMHPIVFPVTTSAPYWMASPAPTPTPQPFWMPSPFQPPQPLSRRATDPSPFYSRSSLSQANQPPCIIEDVDALSDDDEDGTHRDVAEELSKIKARNADSTACVGMEAQLALMRSQIQVKEASRGVRGGQDQAHEGVVAASASATAASQ